VFDMYNLLFICW